MKRLADAPMRDFEILHDAIRVRPRRFGSAVYPPGCADATGPVAFTSADDGSIEITVRASSYVGQGDGLHRLFTQGSLRFPNAASLHAFAKNELFQAFSDVASQRPSPVLVDADALAELLRAEVQGESIALVRLSAVTAAAVARTDPRSPLIVVLAGAPGVGKARTARALAHALDRLTGRSHDLFEFGARQLANDAVAAAVVGVAGWSTDAPLAAALRRPYPVVLVRDAEEANPVVLARIIDDVCTTGFRAPDGGTVANPRAVIMLTSSTLWPMTTVL